MKHVSCNYDQPDLTDVRDLAVASEDQYRARHAQGLTITPARGLMEHLDKPQKVQELHPIQNEQVFFVWYPTIV